MASAAPGVIRDLEIMLSIYKLNMTIMSFQHKRNVGIWCPRRINIEITSNTQRFSDFKFQI